MERLGRHWAVKSLAVGAVASAVDLVLLLTANRLGGLPPGACAATGVLGGALTSFLLNRRYTFRQQGPLMGPALRFAAGTLLLTALHAASVTWLSRQLAAPLLLAKYGSDVLVLLGGNLLLLRYVVFRDAHPPAPGAPGWEPAALTCLPRGPDGHRGSDARNP
jgi:putative flippase GtrA